MDLLGPLGPPNQTGRPCPPGGRRAEATDTKKNERLFSILAGRHGIRGPRDGSLVRKLVDKQFERRLAGLINSGERGVLRGGRKGVEKESLRVTPAGRLAATPHPAALGAALTNPDITTDFSEALIELVTPPFEHSWELLQYLCDLHQFVYRHLGDELLWTTSMPCAIRGDDEIPLARYGSSNVGRMKTIYRRGLGLRYGRMMQAISGVHFNYSFSPRLWDVFESVNKSRAPRQDFVSEQYFAVLRNYRRFGWLILYLFGTSPALSKSFFGDRGHDLQSWTPTRCMSLTRPRCA